MKSTVSFNRFYTSVLLALLSFIIMLPACSKKRSGPPRVLVFSKTAGFVHSSIPNGIAAIQKLGAENGFAVDTTTNSAFFTEDSLAKYAAVIFLSTTGDVLNHRQEVAFERYIQSGGGFAGIHSATDTEYDWGWFTRLVGGQFASHPHNQDAVLHVQNTDHPATKGLPKEWKRFDEWYNFKKLNKEVNVLLTIDEKSYQGGTNGDVHPMSWYHDYDGGRAFYTALGHTEQSYTEPLFLQHLLGGIQYAMGDNKQLDYGKAKSAPVPDDDRFVKTTLTKGTLFEPTELVVLPNLDVLIAQRRGEIMRYRQETKEIQQVGYLNVYHKATVPNVNAEEGLMGMALDPGFQKNNFVYLFYAPIDTSVNRLSRFTYVNGKLDIASEKVILQFYSQRNICCHTGGSIAFGADNLLYLSTGDNSTPFDQPQGGKNHGFAPLDARPGMEQYDARRTAGNTADLRGKILRIRIKEDGSYEIPDGNLFVNNPKGRPEIYVMGNRNPYRISVDRKTGYLYWGEVGPDAANDSMQTRGPKGYDEVNQARKAGYFGWPFFVGDNYAYRQYDYASGNSGEPFNPAQPINNSPNNTGLQQLPPAQPAFIWYPYGASAQFPQVGQGGRNAMAGPVYHTADFPKETRLPEYYNNKLFIYDWIRGWVRAVTMLPNGDFDKMEPFMEGTKFNAPIDMEVGPDGRLYVLEYGSGWFSKNEDAGLARIDYIAGNRPPKVGDLKIAESSGRLPHTFTATVDVTDPEGDALTYKWTIGRETKETKEPRLQHTLSKGGEYNVSVEVVDAQNASAKSNVVTVYAGNAQPQVQIEVKGNRSFYFSGRPVVYNVAVQDAGDSINRENLFVSIDYIQGFDGAAQNLGHQQVSSTIVGKNLVQTLDCKACHKVDEKSVGPSYTQIAARYAAQKDAEPYLMQKIIKGSRGVWGEANMPAHPDLKEEDARQIVGWILSLQGGKSGKASLPAAGSVTPKPAKGHEVFTLQATYTDAGAAGVRPLTGAAAIFLRPAYMEVKDINQFTGFTAKDSAGTRYLQFPQASGWLALPQVHLAGIKAIELESCCVDAAFSGTVQVRLGSPEGTVAGTADIAWKGGSNKISIPVQQGGGKLQDVYIVYTLKGKEQSLGTPLLRAIRFVPQ